MPQDNIKRAIDRGAGTTEGANYEDLTYEGYAPGGVAVLVSTLTDNKQRTVSDIRSYFNKTGGPAGGSGQRRLSVHAQRRDHCRTRGSHGRSRHRSGHRGRRRRHRSRPKTAAGRSPQAPGDLTAVQQALENANIRYASAEQSMIPQTTVTVSGKEAGQVMRLMDMLEDHDDVQKVYANFDIPDSEIEAAESGR